MFDKIKYISHLIIAHNNILSALDMVVNSDLRSNLGLTIHAITLHGV